MKKNRAELGYKPSLRKQLRNNRTLILMSLPAIIFFLVFHYIPMPGAYIAFTDFNYKAGIFASKFVGFDNFRFLFESGKLWQLTRNTVLYNLAFIVIGNLLQVMIAILLNQLAGKWFRKIAQSFMFLPYFISAVLMGLLTYSILNYDYGFLTKLIQSITGEAPKFYSTPEVWPIVIILVQLWQSTGYGVIIYFAVICGMDTSMLEAAKIDGANALQEIRYIILPALKPTAIILILFSIGSILKGNFGLFYNLVGTANASLFPLTDIVETYVYRTLINQFNFSYSAATGLYQSVLGFIIVVVANGIVRRIEPDYALF